MSFELGDVTAEDARVTSWRAAVRNRGNADVIAPRTLAISGQLAERISVAKVPAGNIYPSPATKSGAFWYVPAPAGIQAIWRQSIANDASAISTNALLDRLATVPGQTLDEAGKLVRGGVSAITGIPTWAIPVLLIGGGAFVIMSAAHSFLPDRRK